MNEDDVFGLAEYRPKKRNELYDSLYLLIKNWEESYCYTGDCGGRTEEALLSHARILLAMPEASLKEIYQFLSDCQ